MDKIAPDATVEDVITTLNHPVDYLRNLVGNMMRIKNEHGGALVRIGITVEGRSPHYRVEPSVSVVTALEMSIFDNTDDDLERYFVAALFDFQVAV